MIGFIKKLFGSKPAEVVAEVPYKVETPVVKADGTVTEQAAQAVVKSIAPKAPAKKTAPKKAAPKKQTASAKKSKPKA